MYSLYVCVCVYAWVSGLEFVNIDAKNIIQTFIIPAQNGGAEPLKCM